METCGFIYVSRDYKTFLMRCSYCPIDVEVEKWQEFVMHYRNMHSALELDAEHRGMDLDANSSIKAEFLDEDYQDDDATDEEGEKDDEKEHLKHLDNLKDVLPQDNEVQDGTKIQLEIEAVTSQTVSSLYESDSETSQTEYVETDLKADSNRSAEKEDEKTALATPIYKFHPSFFRRDPRTLTLIKLYKEHPCLWNPENSHYKDPNACKEAYRKMICDLEAKAAMFLNEISLKASIRKIHLQYNTVHKRMLCGTQKSQSVAFTHYTLCSFLQDCGDQKDLYKNEKIRLDFTKKNKLTTELIELYGNFPQLYDHTHSEFSSMNSRKQAYESLAVEISVPNVDINSDDIFRAIQNIRQWYYKSSKHGINAGNEAEQFYLKVCRFLPPKMFKQRLVCEICHIVTSSDHVLQSHIFKAHNIGELPFKCTLCDRSFVGRGELANHKQRVHIGKTHQCGHCERSFAVKSDLQLHIRTHTGQKPFVCELCGKAFRLKSQMNLHVTAIHTKVRAFKCTMCPKDFVKKVDLSDHIKSHLNIRDKICTICGKGFTSCHSLIRHRQIHSEVKKFVCKLCDARFSQFVGLNSHMKRTHNIVRNNLQKATDIVETGIS
ncbi:zinc finger and BTB domain-containing protein 17 [Drosophila persimilis]|uniref:zinc finger and BTB domain-containing protein 17 n=1 Tax=Drosophila persimilis TaxID=7234 RepID=UPI000F097D00|nr:zinc finger and BTB domain-containing protein 17 [Drosophila persimilis]